MRVHEKPQLDHKNNNLGFIQLTGQHVDK